ncbi:hypothetical protein [Burkholderia oklahomensis]|uniref:hypothetical protein n=1 Tax=Burkholderia oklahomensis TaxID=342113 RepID=UPI0012FD8F0A|nr:hypothetical protein [Burkholderia oklahomensis]
MLDVDEDVRFVNGIEFVRSFLRCLMMKVKGNIESSFFIHLNMNFHKLLSNILFAMWIWHFNMKGNGGCHRSDDRGHTIARTLPCLRTCRRHQDPRGAGLCGKDACACGYAVLLARRCMNGLFVVRCTLLSLGGLRGGAMISGCFGLPAHGSRGRAEGRFSQAYQ